MILTKRIRNPIAVAARTAASKPATNNTKAQVPLRLPRVIVTAELTVATVPAFSPVANQYPTGIPRLSVVPATGSVRVTCPRPRALGSSPRRTACK